MRKYLMPLLALCLALCMLCPLAACTETAPDAETTKIPEAPAESSGKTEENDAVTTGNGKVQYTVVVKDQSGAPVVGVVVQLCVNETCLRPNVTDENGQVAFQIENPGDAVPEVQINAESSLEGYEYPADKIVFAAGETTVEIVLNKTAA